MTWRVALVIAALTGGCSKESAKDQSQPTAASQVVIHADDPALVGGITVTPLSVSIRPIKVHSSGNEPGHATTDYLVVQLAIVNNTVDRTFQFESWASSRAASEADAVTAVDDAGKVYQLVNVRSDPNAPVDKRAVRPGRPMTDVLIFKKPADDLQWIELRLPAANVGGAGEFRVRIPKGLIQRDPTTGSRPGG